jgi:protein-L-isoaspartate(D-aspartate) O-methyltransferase
MSLVNTNIEAARQQMVEQQVRAWDVLDPKVLDVLRRVRREAFVPAGFSDLAFADAPIPLGHGEVMLPPKVDGKILQALDLKPTDAVLDVGSGTGFLAACLSRMAARVRSLEIHADLAELAARNLLAAAANNVVVEKADAMQLAETNQYDAIAVSSSLPLYDTRFEQALKVGGRLFVVVGEAPVMEAWLVTRTSEAAWNRVALFETSIPALVNARQPSRFVF